MNLLNKIYTRLARYEVLSYTREDGNRAIYKIVRSSKIPLTKGEKVVGFKAKKVENTGASFGGGWRSFRNERINKTKLTFF